MFLIRDELLIEMWLISTVDGSGAAEAVSLPSALCSCLDHALLWHLAGFLLPALHPALQEQQVHAHTHTHVYTNTRLKAYALAQIDWQAWTVLPLFCWYVCVFLSLCLRIVKMSSPNLNVLTLCGSILTYSSGFLFAFEERIHLQGGGARAILQVRHTHYPATLFPSAPLHFQNNTLCVVGRMSHWRDADGKAAQRL